MQISFFHARDEFNAAREKFTDTDIALAMAMLAG